MHFQFCQKSGNIASSVVNVFNWKYQITRITTEWKCCCLSFFFLKTVVILYLKSLFYFSYCSWVTSLYTTTPDKTAATHTAFYQKKINNDYTFKELNGNLGTQRDILLKLIKLQEFLLLACCAFIISRKCNMPNFPKQSKGLSCFSI